MPEPKFESQILNEIYESMVQVDEDKTVELVQKALDSGTDVLKITNALTAGITTVGEKFEVLEYFLPELIIAGNAMERSMEVLQPEIEKLDLHVGETGTIVMANLQGDIHDIGRSIVSMMLRVSGFKVHDLGHDVRADAVIDAALNVNADVIGLSSLLTTSLPFARDVLELLKERGVRDRFKVIMGGGAVTPEYCDQVGVDGYAADAVGATKLMQRLTSGR